MRATPELCLDLARRFEGLRLKAYRCPAGIWTIGIGSTGADIVEGMTCTEEWAIERARRDLRHFTREAIRLCPVLATESDERLAAIVDFAYNAGAARLAASTLRRRINARDWQGAADELLKWVWGGGRKLPGLVVRRQAGRQLLLAA